MVVLDPKRKGEDGCLEFGQDDGQDEDGRHQNHETHSCALQLPRGLRNIQSEASILSTEEAVSMKPREHNGVLKVNWEEGMLPFPPQALGNPHLPPIDKAVDDDGNNNDDDDDNIARREGAPTRLQSTHHSLIPTPNSPPTSFLLSSFLP